MRKDAGFTLIELIIIIVIVGALTAIAVPNFMTYQSNFRLRGALSTLRGDLVGARMLAIKRFVQYRVFFTAGGYQIQRWDEDTTSYIDEVTRNFADEYQGVTAAATANPVFSPKGTVTPVPPPITITLQGGQRTQTITIFIAGKIKVN
ncbi:MAG: prepilin-type N-terminal cleavage/methylation domain-containing protein [Candidatus Desulfatibia sp.]|uniref:pilus assembly FimT family protein n=1 Tax=Candidatus Desulfatibia sp. TaxID=3101189 RepID=UPI002F2CD5E0